MIKTIVKEICIKCRNDKGNIYKWQLGDEMRWQLGVVWCPTEYIPNNIEETTPPQKCPYRLEHLMKTQEEAT